jgi:hypothetical protein
MMGMLFNTPGTLRMLKALNERFRKDRFTHLQAHLPANLIYNLSNLTGNVGPNGIHDKVCTLLGMDDWDPDVSANWRTFLNILDRTACAPQIVAGAPGNPTISGEIGRALALALQSMAPYQNVTSVEYFAVPTSARVPNLNIQPLTDGNGDQTLIVTVTTTTYDQVRSA